MRELYKDIDTCNYGYIDFASLLNYTKLNSLDLSYLYQLKNWGIQEKLSYSKFIELFGNFEKNQNSFENHSYSLETKIRNFDFPEDDKYMKYLENQKINQNKYYTIKKEKYYRYYTPYFESLKINSKQTREILSKYNTSNSKIDKNNIYNTIIKNEFTINSVNSPLKKELKGIILKNDHHSNIIKKINNIQFETPIKIKNTIEEAKNEKTIENDNKIKKIESENNNKIKQIEKSDEKNDYNNNIVITEYKQEIKNNDMIIIEPNTVNSIIDDNQEKSKECYSLHFNEIKKENENSTQNVIEKIKTTETFGNESFLNVPIDNKNRKNSAIFESTISNLENLYASIKKYSSNYLCPIIYLMSNENLNDKIFIKYLKIILMNLLNINSFAIIDNDVIRTNFKKKNELYNLLQSNEKFQDHLNLNNNKSKFFIELEENIFFIHKTQIEKKKFIFIYELSSLDNQDFFYLYFRVLEQNQIIKFEDNLSLFILKIHSEAKKEEIKNEFNKVDIISKDYMNLLESYISNIKIVYLNEIRKELEKSFNSEINLQLINEINASSNSKRRFSCLKELLDCGDNTTENEEIKLQIRGELYSFQIKVKVSNLNKNYFAIVYEQTMDMFYMLKNFLNNFSEKLFFYGHFLENNSNLMLDFDKNGNLIFQNMPINSELKNLLGMNDSPIIIKKNFKLQFINIFPIKTQIYLLVTSKLQTKSKLKNLKECLANKMKFLSDENELINNNNNNNIIQMAKILIRSKSKSFKGFYILLTISSNSIENNFGPQKRKIMSDFPKRKRQMKTSAMESRNLIMKSATMRNSILLDYVDDNCIKDILQLDKKISIPAFKNKSDSIYSDSKLKHILIQSLQEKERKKKILYDIKTKPEKTIFNENNSKFEEISNLNFNVLNLEINDLFYLSWKLLNQLDFFSKFNTSIDSYSEFVWRIERKYNKRNNPFHNFYHALTVMHGCYSMVTLTPLKYLMTDFDKIALTLSGLCHDVAHTGHNNLFEINSFSKFALRYNDKSVLENHHLSTTFKVLGIPGCNIFEKFDKSQFQSMRKMMINNILSTDMKEHFTILHNFELKTNDFQNCKEKMVENENDKFLLYGTTIHCCDFFGNVKPFDISRTWSEKVNIEFSNQYLDETKLNIPQTPYYKDLDKKTTMIKSEINFNKIIIQPLWLIINRFYDDTLHVCMENNKNNIVEWEKLLEMAENEVICHDYSPKSINNDGKDKDFSEPEKFSAKPSEQDIEEDDEESKESEQND